MALLETHNLTKGFGGLVAVRDVSFDVQPNDILGIIGPNGAGKTTLFNLITGLEKSDSGDIIFEGRSIQNMRPHSICKLGIARTYQTVRPFLNHSVRENIAVGVTYGRPYPKGVDRNQKIVEILDFLNLRSKEHTLAKNLPIEERKMVEVGRAIAANPKLLMLDEPMAGLNSSEVSHSVNLIKELREKGLTVLIVEHVMKAISSACTRVLVLHHGETLAQGTPSEVLSNQQVIDVYLGESYSKPSS